MKKIKVVLSSDKEEKEWIATPVEGPRVEQRHPSPGTAIGNLSDVLRQSLGEDIEIEYELKLSPSLQKELEQLQQEERALKALSDRVKEKRYRFASACLDRRIRQHDIADLMQLSQSYVNTIIRTKGQVTAAGTGTSERILSRRRRTDV